MPLKIALFASGSGSNAENIINFFSKSTDLTFPTIISNKSDAFVHERAKKMGIHSYTFSREEFSTGENILALLKQQNIDCIVLAGFLLRIPQALIDAFPQRIINIHPALLPKYGGKGMYGMNVHHAVVENKEKETGITIHFVNENYDEGNVIFQKEVALSATDSPENVAEKIHELEQRYFPEVIEKLITHNL